MILVKFAIDLSSTVREKEVRFCRPLLFFGTRDERRTVVYSRINDQELRWPLESPILIPMLKDFFEFTGHTLAIDTHATYARLLAFDIDCLCRKGLEFNHVDLSLMIEIKTFLVQMVQRLFGCTLVVSLWNNKCGYHVYTNQRVSLPTHLYLNKQLELKFLDRPVVIEVPRFMPLPYSAKDPSNIYKPMDSLLLSEPMTFESSQTFWEMFEFSKELNSDEQAYIELQNSQNEVLFMKKTNRPKETTDYPNIAEFSITKSINYMTVPLHKHILSIVSVVNKSGE